MFQGPFFLNPFFFIDFIDVYLNIIEEERKNLKWRVVFI